MAHTIASKLNNPANEFQAGESIGFGIRMGVRYQDPKTKQSEWTNYSAVIFAKSPNQIQYYREVLVEGSIVVVSCETQKINSFDGQSGQILSIDMLNARLENAFNSSVPPPQQQARQQAPAPQQQQAPQYQAPQQQRPAPPPQNHQQGQYQQQPQQNYNQQSQAPNRSEPAPQPSFDDD